MYEPVGLYIHIPFCRSKCAYCDFYSLPNPGGPTMERYARALHVHLTEAAGPMRENLIDTVYFGGGTPTFWGEKHLTATLKLIKKLYPLSAQCEITLEANPDSVDYKMLKRLRRAGFNRLSLGVQSDSDDLLYTLGRPHSFVQAEEAVESARKAGFRNLSVDLMFGLPGQTVENLSATLGRFLALKPEHISAYGLQLEEGTPLYERREGLSVPDGDAQADMFLHIDERLERAGYEHYEISNFAVPGYRSRHNMKYWTLEEYLGFGPAAHSDIGGRRFSNVRDVEGYIDAVLSGKPVVAEMESIPRLERAGEYVMLSLRLKEGLSGNEYTRRYRVSFEPLEQRLEKLVAPGYVQQSGDRWRLTPRGFLMSNAILVSLMGEEAEFPDPQRFR